MVMMVMMVMMVTLTWLDLQLTQLDFPFSQQLGKPPAQWDESCQWNDNDGLCDDDNLPGWLCRTKSWWGWKTTRGRRSSGWRRHCKSIFNFKSEIKLKTLLIWRNVYLQISPQFRWMIRPIPSHIYSFSILRPKCSYLRFVKRRSFIFLAWIHQIYFLKLFTTLSKNSIYRLSQRNLSSRSTIFMCPYYYYYYYCYYYYCY